MPSVQRGSVVKRGASWSARWYDEAGTRRSAGGFPTKSAANDHVDAKVKEVAALRRGDLPSPGEIPTVRALVEAFLVSHEVDQATTDRLRSELKHAVREFGDRRADKVTPQELSAWRVTLPARSRPGLFRAFKQVLEDAVTLGLLRANPAARIKNKQVRDDVDREFRPFTSWDEIDSIAAELSRIYKPIPLMLVGTGLRPEELFGLEWRDVDVKAGVLNVERVYTQGRLKPCRKSDRQRRRVPLRQHVLEAIDGLPRHLDGTAPVFPAADGGPIRLETFRNRNWTPALVAAGIPHRRVYDCRHTFATWSIRAGVGLFYLSRIMGTSVAQIDATYGHFAPDSEDYLRGLLDTFDEGFGHGMGAATAN